VPTKEMVTASNKFSTATSLLI